ncbi:MAG: efflux RND transporter permease subunit [Candidatus Sericytochromatia bacterium]
MKENQPHTSNSFNISEIAIKKPVATILMMITMIVMGIFSYNRLNVELFPNVEWPIVAITTEYPGASSQEIETLITKPIENSISGISGLRHLRSNSGNGFSTIIAEFKLDKSVETAANEVKEKTALVRYELPKEAKDSIVLRIDPAAFPIINYVISAGADLRSLTELTKYKIKNELQKVEGVSNITLKGAEEREIQVLLDPLLLKNFSIAPEQVVNRLKEENLNFPSGQIKTTGKTLALRTMSALKTVNEISNIQIKTIGNRTVYLSDLGTVIDGTKEIANKAWINGKPAVVMEIQKQSSANTVKTIQGLEKKVLELKKSLPPSVSINKSFDTSEFILEAKNAAMEELIIGSVLAIIVIFIFLRTFGGTIISALAIPTSIISTYTMMYFLNFSINTMTLLALSLVVGVLVDDAVVDLENIYRRMELGEDPYTAAIKATDEIGLAVVSTTFSIVAVFVPIAFMSGIIGKYFTQFGLTVSVSVLISLLVARTLTPSLAAHTLNPLKNHHEKKETFLTNTYKDILKWALKHRIITTVIAISMFLISIPIAGLLPQGFTPKNDKSEVWVTLSMAQGISLEKAITLVKKAEKIVAKDKDVKEVLAVLGDANNNASFARLSVTLKSKNEGRKTTGFAVQERLRKELEKVSGFLLTVKTADPNEDPNNSYALNLSVRGDDLEKMQTLAENLVKKLKTMPIVSVAKTSIGIPQGEIHIKVDRKKAGDMGISSAQIASILRTSTFGEISSKIYDNEKDFDLRVKLDDKSRNNLDKLRMLTVLNNKGQNITLDSISKIEYSKGPNVIERYDRQRQVMVYANTIMGVSLSEILDPMKKELENTQIPAGITYSFEGDAEMMQEAFNSLLIALGMAIFFIYIILGSQFESFIHPLTIMVALPLSFVGAFLGLFIANQEIGIMSLIGIVMLMGLVTKNSILLVDYTITLRKQGLNRYEALIEAGIVRIRPILMTTAAMIAGMLPSALQLLEASESRSPMAVAVIGGVIASTLLSLVMVPVFYTYMDDLSNFVRKFFIKNNN